MFCQSPTGNVKIVANLAGLVDRFVFRDMRGYWIDAEKVTVTVVDAIDEGA